MRSHRAFLVSVLGVALVGGCTQGHDNDAGGTASVDAEYLFGRTSDHLGERVRRRLERRSALFAKWLDALCTQRDGSYNCSCERWWNPEGVDCGGGGGADECATGTDDCDANATCSNTPASYTCTCNAGYAGDGVTCSDVDECETGADNCSDDASCENTEGGFSCTCDEGYEGDGVDCAEQGACELGLDDCSADATCSSTDDGFTCTCNPGYEGDGVTCTQVETCASDPCGANATCSDSAGGFTCECDAGYSGDGVTCVDVNECDQGTDNCSPNASCTNTGGSFSCQCNPGFSGDGVICIEDDACGQGTDNCSPDATCNNTGGGFVCVCNPGFSGDGVSCSDVDECAQGTDNCSPNATCTNTNGSFSCQCNSGFSGDGVSCSETNECAQGTDNCSPNATCTNTNGSFSCACNAGFSGDGVSCTDVDECSQGTDNCSPNATCTNSAGSFSCACNAGFSGNGVSCSDVDECSQGTDNCSPNATCTNSAGSFGCACNPGYEGNGVSCTPVATSCDLSGTFATLVEIDLEWDAVVVSGLTAISGGSSTTFSWAIRRQQQNGSTVEVETVACNGTAPDLCSPLFGEAYTQYYPAEIWERPTMPVELVTVNLADAPDPGDPFVGPIEAALLGLELENPTGPWPAAYNDPAITWVDHDGDGQPGITSYMRDTGSSAVCSMPYANLPIPATGGRAARVYTGSRSLARLDGTLADCDTVVGDLVGPTGGMPLVQGHVIGCLTAAGAPCTAAEIESLDGGVSEDTQRILGARFTMVRVPDDVTCQDVEALDFP